MQTERYNSPSNINLVLFIYLFYFYDFNHRTFKTGKQTLNQH